MRSSDAEGARKLIEQGANPDIVNLEGTTPLMVSTSYPGTWIWLDMFLNFKYGPAGLCVNLAPPQPPTTATEYTILTVTTPPNNPQLAARKGRVEVASVLVSAGANKALADRGSKNALMWAAEENHLEVARLVRRSIQPNLQIKRVLSR